MGPHIVRQIVSRTVATLVLAGSAVPAAPQPSSVPLTVYTPSPERFDAALDEIELQWASEAIAAPNVVGSGGATLERRSSGGAVFRVQRTGTLQEVVAAMREVESRNPGARGYLVLYESNRPRNDSTRRLLGRDVAVLLDDDRDPRTLLHGFAGAGVRPVEAVPRAYVVEAADPLEAVRVAEALRNAPGVRTSYPLLRRTRSTR